jgi:hypothetical protein
MNQDTTKYNVLTDIEEGMDVFDTTGKQIGKVKYVRFGDEDSSDLNVESAPERHDMPTDALMETVADAFTGDNDVPEELAQKLLRYGYIRIDSGMFSGDRFATPEEIARVVDDHVQLKVNADSLIIA